MAIFNIAGKINPVKFRPYDKVVRVEKVMKTYEERLLEIKDEIRKN